MTNTEKVNLLDWVHDTILYQCETVGQARAIILNETIRLINEEEYLADDGQETGVKPSNFKSLVVQFDCINETCEFHDKNYEQNCLSVHNTGVYPEDCADSKMELSDSAKLEWIWANCSIIHRDVVEQWDVEHCLWRGKDERAFIEAQMPNDQHQFHRRQSLERKTGGKLKLLISFYAKCCRDAFSDEVDIYDRCFAQQVLMTTLLGPTPIIIGIAILIIGN